MAAAAANRRRFRHTWRSRRSSAAVCSAMRCQFAWLPLPLRKQCRTWFKTRGQKSEGGKILRYTATGSQWAIIRSRGESRFSRLAGPRGHQSCGSHSRQGALTAGVATPLRWWSAAAAALAAPHPLMLPMQTFVLRQKKSGAQPGCSYMCGLAPWLPQSDEGKSVGGPAGNRSLQRRRGHCNVSAAPTPGGGPCGRHPRMRRCGAKLRSPSGGPKMGGPAAPPSLVDQLQICCDSTVTRC